MIGSTLHAVIGDLRAGRQLRPEQIDELERLLDVLRGEGWGGVLPADEAAQVLVRAREVA